MLKFVTGILVFSVVICLDTLSGVTESIYNKDIPVSPTNLEVLDYAFDYVLLAWEDNSSDEAFFIVERGNTEEELAPYDTVDANETLYIDYRIEPNVGYYYRLVAFNPSGLSDYSNTVSVNTQPLPHVPPNNPSNLEAEFNGTNINTLTWNDNSYNELSFKIYRSTNNTDFIFLDSTYVNINEYEDYNIQSRTHYYYYVFASNRYGVSASTDTAHVYVSDVQLATPPLLFVQRTTHNEIHLAWSDLPGRYRSLSLIKSIPNNDSLTIDISTKTTYIDDDLESNTAYNYQLELVDLSGSTYRSSRIEAVTLPMYAQERINDSLVAFIVFSEKSLDSIQDWSWYKEPLGLTLAEPIEAPEVPVDYLRISTENSVSSKATSKIAVACKYSGEISVECWIKTSVNIDEAGTPTRIISFENDESLAFALNCQKDPLNPDKVIYSTNLSTITTDNQGNPALSASQSVDVGVLQHIVYTHCSTGSESMYINGNKVSSSFRPPSYANWSDTNTFILANDITADAPWLGDIYMCAVYSKALSDDEVLTNYYASPFLSDSIQLNPNAYTIHLYPNPVSDDAKVELVSDIQHTDFTTSYYIDIIDHTGMVIQSQNKSEFLDGRVFELSFSNLDCGIYTVILKNAYGIITSTKVAVIR